MYLFWRSNSLSLCHVIVQTYTSGWRCAAYFCTCLAILSAPSTSSAARCLSSLSMMTAAGSTGLIRYQGSVIWLATPAFVYVRAHVPPSDQNVSVGLVWVFATWPYKMFNFNNVNLRYTSTNPLHRGPVRPRLRVWGGYGMVY